MAIRATDCDVNSGCAVAKHIFHQNCQVSRLHILAMFIKGDHMASRIHALDKCLCFVGLTPVRSCQTAFIFVLTYVHSVNHVTNVSLLWSTGQLRTYDTFLLSI